MADVYATRSDLYKYGLPRGSLGNPGRLVASCLASTDTIELSEHGFETDDAITLRASEGGTLSAPLVAGTTYYVIRLNDSSFQVAAAPAGPAIDLTTDGVSIIVSADLPVDALLERFSRWADGFVPAHAVPLLAPYPIAVVAVVAELTARRLQILAGTTSESMKDIELAAKAQLERWATGVPFRDARAARPTNTAVADTTGDPRGWAPNGSGYLP